MASSRFSDASDQLSSKKTQQGSYWNETGRHQDKDAVLGEKLRELVGDRYDFPWTKRSNAHWALFNGMRGLYYGHYNDGDNAEGAIDNNRVHGYSSVKEFEALASDLKAEAVKAYLRYGSERNLEKAMDEAILICWEKTHFA